MTAATGTRRLLRGAAGLALILAGIPLLLLPGPGLLLIGGGGWLLLRAFGLASGRDTTAAGSAGAPHHPSRASAAKGVE